MFRIPLGTAALVAAVLFPTVLPAQDTTAARNGWELLLSSGALLPTGAQRVAIKSANLSTAQLSYVFGSRFAITAMGGWARSRDLSTADDPKLDVFTVDAGLESRWPRLATGKSASFTPFVGAGAGSRSYRHRHDGANARHNLAAYASIGSEIGMRRVRVRLDVRDYVTGFKPLADGASGSATRMRNDVVVMAGLRLVRR